MRITQLLVIGAVVSCVPAVAQQPAAQKPQSNAFGTLFPHPTGQNAMEFFVKAGDLLANNSAWRTASADGGGLKPLTLSEKRSLMSDPELRRALSLLREGLARPAGSVHDNLDDETPLPELALFRQLARMLAVEMYVELADGKVSNAIGTLEDSLQFSYDIHRDTLIGGLVSMAMDAIAINSFAPHLDQLSVQDCRRLMKLANTWLDMPDPALSILKAERDGCLKILDKYRSQPDKLMEMLNAGQPRSAEMDSLGRSLKENPDAVGPVFNGAGAKMNAFYNRAAQELSKPVWERGSIDLPPDDHTPAHKLFSYLCSSINTVLERYGQDQARVQLLGVHAAIHLYRWEQDKLPANLAELKIGRLAVDPFTGKPIEYRKLDETRYELSSVGPPNHASDATPGSRSPIRLE